MAENLPEFDFESYDPRDPWGFPPQRLVRFAFEAAEIFRGGRDRVLPRYQYPDVRYVWFHELAGSAHALKVFSISIRDNIATMDWWEAHPELGRPGNSIQLRATSMSLRENLDYGFFSYFLRKTEDLLRMMQQHIAHTLGDQPRKSIRQVIGYLLDKTHLSDHMGLLDLAYAMRTCMQNAGKFCPASGKGISLEYQEKTYDFDYKAELKAWEWDFYDNYDFQLFLFREVNELLFKLFDHALVASLPLLKSRYLD